MNRNRSALFLPASIIARTLPVWACAATLVLSSLFLSSVARAQASSTSLNPAQLEIERERRRLSSSDKEERRDALMRLAWMARADASRAAVSALQDTEPIVRATAARSVLSLPADEAARALLPLLQDKDEFVRQETAYALGETHSPLAVAPLVTMLERDKKEGVRGAAAVALGNIGDEAAVIPLAARLSARIRSSGLFSKITRGQSAENEFVRRAAARSLGQIKSRAAVPALVETLSDARTGDDVRREAARSLGLIGDVSAVPALRTALAARDPYLSRIAYEALLKIAPAEANRPL
ncbi:MAG TPA: HEAT repeat domain-containing protein [Pyrinomonadaceae bacterium]